MKKILKKINQATRSAIIFLIQSYRILISPYLGSCCRFYPSCSVYAQQAIQTRGVIQGIYLASIRLLKCQPLHPGGVDVVKTRT